MAGSCSVVYVCTYVCRMYELVAIYSRQGTTISWVIFLYFCRFSVFFGCFFCRVDLSSRAIFQIAGA